MDNYVMVNIWTSASNKALPGANVGHISIQTADKYISLWPGAREVNISSHSLQFHKRVKRKINNYFEVRKSNFKQDYLADCISEAISEGNYREIKDIHTFEFRDNERPFFINENTLEYRKLVNQEVGIHPAEVKLAIVPCKANVRLKLYSLDIVKLLEKFEKISKLPGWTLLGSNVFTRSNDKTAQNCSSLIFELLKQAGMYAELPKESSLETASIVTPDVLARHVITFKLKEQEKEEYAWTKKQLDNDDVSNLDELINAYKIIGKNHDDLNITEQFRKINKN